METQELAQPFDDRTHNEAGLNFERMGSEPEAELLVIDDLCFRSDDEYLANGSPIGGAQVNSMWTEAYRQVADAKSRAIEFNRASLVPIQILSGPTAKGDEQDAMDTSVDIVATKAVVDRVPFNAAGEYLHQVQVEPAPIVAVPTPNLVDMVQEAYIADSRATTIVRAPLDTYHTMISPEIRANVDSMGTEGADKPPLQVSR